MAVERVSRLGAVGTLPNGAPAPDRVAPVLPGLVKQALLSKLEPTRFTIEGLGVAARLVECATEDTLGYLGDPASAHPQRGRMIIEVARPDMEEAALAYGRFRNSRITSRCSAASLVAAVTRS